MTIILKMSNEDFIQYFPFAKIRKEQKKAIKFILEEFNSAEPWSIPKKIVLAWGVLTTVWAEDPLILWISCAGVKLVKSISPDNKAATRVASFLIGSNSIVSILCCDWSPHQLPFLDLIFDPTQPKSLVSPRRYFPYNLKVYPNCILIKILLSYFQTVLCICPFISLKFLEV